MHTKVRCTPPSTKATCLAVSAESFQLHADYYSAASGFGLAFEAKVATELSHFCSNYRAGRDGLWLARTDDVEASIAIDASHAEADGAHLRWFIVSESLRGQGIGQQLLRTALRFCDQRGYRKTYLWTFAGLEAARHLFEANGFRLVRESLGSQWGTPVQEQLFLRGDA